MDWKARVRAAFSTASRIPDNDVIEELAQHLRSLREAARAEDSSEAEADDRVAAQLRRWRDDAPALRHRTRRAAPVEAPPAASSSPSAVLGAGPLSGMVNDLRYAARLLRRQRRYSILAIFTIALGIAATTILFSVTYGVLFKPLPWPNGDRLVLLKETRGGKPPRFGSVTNAAYLAWREKPATIEGIGAWSQRTVTLSGTMEPERIRITASTASLLPVLGARPLIGSLFQEEDEGSPVVVLSESLWRQRFGGDAGAVGRRLLLDGESHTVVGVLPDALLFPDRQSRAWVSMRVTPATGNSLSVFEAVAKLRRGSASAQAAAEATARGRTAPDSGLTSMAIFGSRGPIEVSAVRLRDELTADVRRPLLVLLAAAVLLLVVATANVASLQLARATGRRRELAIRAALGAGGSRVTRQLLLENLLVGLAGGTVGLLLAGLMHRLLPALLPADFPRGPDVRVDATVVLFAFCLSVATGIGFGLWPAIRLRRQNLVESLVDDGAAPTGAGSRTATARARMLIMSAQVAIACVLLVGASLVARSFGALVRTDRGYDPAGLLTARLSLSTYTPERRSDIAGRILDRLSASPAIAAAAFTSELPLTPGGSTAAFTVRPPRGSADAAVLSVQASPRLVAPRYFPVVRMRVISGRGFSESDTDTSAPVAVVNRTFAHRYLNDGAIGATLPMGAGYQQPSADAVIVGVVEDVKYLEPGSAAQPEIYFSFRQMKGRLPVPVVTLVVRGPGDPREITPLVQSAVREADRSLVPDSILTMEDRMLRGLARPRLYAVLLGGFAVVALVIAGVGLFGVLSYSVAQRSRELAVRTALGARRADLAWLVLRQALTISGLGILVGLAPSFALSRSMATLLYGVTTRDPVTFIGVPLLLAVVSVAACLAPAWRAARLDPVRTLRA